MVGREASNLVRHNVQDILAALDLMKFSLKFLVKFINVSALLPSGAAAAAAAAACDDEACCLLLLLLLMQFMLLIYMLCQPLLMWRCRGV
jgi:hypothetical protein